jgi:hypothetical protein
MAFPFNIIFDSFEKSSHPGESRVPGDLTILKNWIPAFAGMT